MDAARTCQSTRKSNPPALLLGAVLCVLGLSANAATLYKWVDEDGNVHYSSQLPANQNKKGHQQLNKQGVVLTTQEAAKSAEELAVEAEEKRKLEAEQAEQARIKAAQDAQDRVLLLTFSSEAEIEHARENRIEVIDSVIRLINSSIESTQTKLDELKHSAETNYTAHGNEIPGGLAQKIEHAERKIESRNAQLRAKEEEKAKIYQKYETDLERYRELSATN